MSRFNILYWNINSKGGKKYKYIDESSKLIEETLINIDSYSRNKYVSDCTKKHKNVKIKEIDAIVFSEAYPEKINPKLCNGIKGMGFELFSGKDYGNDIHIYINKNKHDAEEYNIKIPLDNIRYPDFRMVYIKNINLYLAGIRIKNYTRENRKKVLTGKEQIYNLCKKLKDVANNKILIIGDFNPYSAFVEVPNDDLFNAFGLKGKIIDTNNGGTTVKSDGCNKNNNQMRYLQEVNTDKLFYSSKFDSKNNEIVFNKFITPEEIYCNNKYINETDGHIDKNMLEFRCKDGNKRRSIIINKKSDFYKNGFDDEIIGLRYMNGTICNAPFPDHNLLFASIDLGDV